MQSPIFPVIGQRLVAGVDNGAIELHPLINVVDDVIGALAQLEIHLARWLGRLEIERERIRLSNASRAGEDLPGGKKSQQRSKNRRSELGSAPHQIILVPTNRTTVVMVHVVLDDCSTVLTAQSN